jgi:hypothetical protein
MTMPSEVTDTRGFPDGEIVTPDKVVAFLSDKVVNRPPRSRKRKQVEEEEEEEALEMGRTVGQSTVTGYLTALTAL